MDSRKPILIFMYSERLKSELIIASHLCERFSTLPGEERIGAEKILTAFLEALTGEIRIAQNIEKTLNFLGAEKRVQEAIGRMKLSEFQEMRRSISEAISLITKSSLKAMEALEEMALL